MKNKTNFFSSLFDDNNTINEKSIIGFISFFFMCVLVFTDVLSTIVGKEIKIEEYIYNLFLVLTLGSLGIGSADKFINRKRKNYYNEDEYSEEDKLG